MVDKKILSDIKHIYMVGIGGIGMSGIALLLKDKGFAVSGSDLADSYTTKNLKDAGIKVFVGHSAQNLPADADLVVYSSAVKSDNPEMIETKRRGIGSLRRGEMLGLLSWDKLTIAVAGSHGKTTTTGFIGYILGALGYNPAVCVGGVPLNYAKNAWWGGDYFVIETDESDGSFLYYNPWVSVITNVDREHLDYYHGLDDIEKSFLKFAYQTQKVLVGCGDDAVVARILKQVTGISYGLGPANRLRAENISFDTSTSLSINPEPVERVDAGKTGFDFYLDGRMVSRVQTSLLGEHNVLNTLAVLAVLHYMQVDLNQVIPLLKDFKGTKRRFQVKGVCGGVTFVDDYGHHPTEIAAVLKAARLLKPARVVAVFQPHRFTRVKALKDEFIACFALADEAIVTDIYAASEEPIDGVNSSELCRSARYVPKERLVQEVVPLLKEGDLVIGLGAGDINILMEGVLDAFKRSRVEA